MRCDELELVPGCLLHIALVDCLALLAHGVANGFGGTDASGTKDSLPLAKGMLQLLLDLVEEDGILWGRLAWCCGQRVPRLLASIFTHPSKSQRVWQHNHPCRRTVRRPCGDSTLARSYGAQDSRILSSCGSKRHPRSCHACQRQQLRLSRGNGELCSHQHRDD